MNEISILIIPVTPFAQNCSLVWETESKRGVVIDPGGDLDRVRDAITKNDVKVEKIWLTHGHIDHAGGAAELRETGNIQIEGPDRGDLFLLENLAQTGAAYGIQARNVVPDRWLQEGDVCHVGSIAFDVLHCPGHSPGSVAFVNKPLSLAFVGDVLFQGSVGRTDIPGGNHDTLIRSITDKLMPLDDKVQFVCGHGQPSSIGAERRYNPFLK